MKFDKEFKEAISHLPAAEKDKLILRLLKKDQNLAKRLYFELLDERTIDERRLEMEKKVCDKTKRISETFWTTGYLKMDMRFLSGEITEHVRITKDKYGEASLNLLMLNNILQYNNDRIRNATPSNAYKIGVYIIARAFKILIIIRKLHQDCFLDFQENLRLLAKQIENNHYLAKTAIHNGFDVNWLIKSEIPENIDQIHSELRKQGYLK